MQGIDPSAIGPRAPAAAAEPIAVTIALPAAQDLGLRDHEVVHAIVEADGNALRVQVGTQTLQLPSNAAWLAGHAVLIRHVRQAGTSLLQVRLAANGETARTEGSMTAAHAEGLPVQAPPWVPASTATAGGVDSLGLLLAPLGASTLSRLLAGNGLENLLAAFFPNASREFLAPLRARPEQLDGTLVQRLFANSGLFAEAMLARGRTPMTHDLKLLLLRLADALPAGSPNHTAIGQALHELSAQQMKALQAQTEHQLHWSMQIPFSDGHSVRLTLQRGRREGDEPPPPFVFHVESDSRELGEVTLQTRVTLPRRIDMVMWAVRSEVAAMARDQAPRLARSLEEAGLELAHMSIHEGRRPAASRPDTPSGLLLDREA